MKQANINLALREQALMNALSSLKQSHEEFRAAQSQLIQAAKFESAGRLAAGVAHEVKNPLATLLIGVEHLAHHFPMRDETITSSSMRSRRCRRGDP